MHLFILQQLMVILDMQWLLKGMLFSKGNQVMKKWLFVILSVVVIWGIYRYCNDKLEENAGVSNHGGIHQYEEEAIVEDINLDNREIVVRIKESDTYLESKKNPYKDKKISLDCSKVKKEELDNIEISDEIVFTHLYDEPHTVLDVKRLL